MIKKINHLLHLDTQYFISGGFFSFIQQVIGVSCGLVVSYLSGHFLSKSMYGEYNLVLSIVSMLTFFSLPGIDTALVRSIGQGYDASLLTSVRMKFRLSLFAVPILTGFSIYYGVSGKQTISLALLLCALAFPFLNTFSTYGSFLSAKKRFSTLAIVSSAASIFFLLVMTASIVVFPSTPTLIASYSIGMIVPSIIGFMYSTHLIRTTSKHDHDLTSYGSFLTLLSILPWISGSLGNIILGSIVGPESLAVYAVALGFFVSVQKNFMVFYKPVTVKLAHQTVNEHFQTLAQHFLKLIIIGTGLTVVLWITLPFLVTFFFTRTYGDAISYGRLLSLGLIPLPLSWVLSDIVVFQKNKRVQVALSTIPQTIKIILYIITIPIWQVNGLVAVFLLERYTDPIIRLLILAISKKNILYKT